MKNPNRIPRNFKTIYATALFGSGEGHLFKIFRDEVGMYKGIDQVTQKEYVLFRSHVNNEHCFRFERVELKEAV